MFEKIEAVRKYPLEAKRRLVVIVTAVIVAPIVVAWIIWFFMTLDLSALSVAEEVTPTVPDPGILPPYSN